MYKVKIDEHELNLREVGNGKIIVLTFKVLSQSGIKD